MQHEIWKAIPWAPGYEVSSHGRVRSWRKTGKRVGERRKTPLMLKLSPRSSRSTRSKRSVYLAVCLSKGDGTFKTMSVHTLVLEAFEGPCPPGMQGRHRDDRDTRNNAIENLCWGTALENRHDQYTHGTSIQGERVGTASITNERAQKILDATGSIKSIAAEHGAGYHTVWKIKRRVSWKHLTAQVD